MFDEQLDFARNKDLDEDNYFIYNTNEPKLERNYISDLNQAEIYTGISNEHKIPFIPMETQLDYLQQPSLPVFPIDKPNPLFYNSEIEQKGNEHKVKQLMKRITGGSGGSSSNTKVKRVSKGKHKHKKQKQQQQQQHQLNKRKEMCFNSGTNTNNKGLFDPELKTNELDYPSHTQKQRMERMQKILNYDKQFGKKLNNLAVYNKMLDQYRIMQNNKSNPITQKYKPISNKELFEQMKLIKPNVNYSKCNLDFDFSHYDAIIKSLQDEINKERKMRADVNMKYLEKMQEIEEMQIEKKFPPQLMNKVKNNKRAKSALKIYQPRRKAFAHLRKVKPIRSGKKNKNKSKSNSKRSKSSNNKQKQVQVPLQEMLQSINNGNVNDNKAKNILNQNNMNQFFSELEVKKNKIVRDFLSSNSITSSSNIPKQQTPSKTKYNSNTAVSNNKTSLALSNNNNNNNEQRPIEEHILNEILLDETTQQQQQLNKYQLVAHINNSLDKYSKAFPIVINNITEAIDKITKINIFDESTHPIIKMASKTTSQQIQNNIESLTENIIDDLLLELVYDLTYIEERANHKYEQQKFSDYISSYTTNIQNIRKEENEIMNKLSKSQKYPFTYNSTRDNNDNVIVVQQQPPRSLDPFINDDDDYVSESKVCYSTAVHPKLLNNVEEYSKQFEQMMKLSGQFYFPNVFGVYDKVVDELTMQILSETVDECVHDFDDVIYNIYKDEVVKASSNI